MLIYKQLKTGTSNRYYNQHINKSVENKNKIT